MAPDDERAPPAFDPSRVRAGFFPLLFFKERFISVLAE
jgi:hypothetical protein